MAFAPSVVVLWVAALAAGAAGASIDVGITSVVSDNTPMSARAAAMAGWNALTGARGIVAAFLMSALLQVGPRRRHDRAAALRRLDRDRRGALRQGRHGPGRLRFDSGRADDGGVAASGGIRAVVRPPLSVYAQMSPTV